MTRARSMAAELDLVLEAAAFAADKYRMQRRPTGTQGCTMGGCFPGRQF